MLAENVCQFLLLRYPARSLPTVRLRRFCRPFGVPDIFLADDAAASAIDPGTHLCSALSATGSAEQRGRRYESLCPFGRRRKRCDFRQGAQCTQRRRNVLLGGRAGKRNNVTKRANPRNSRFALTYLFWGCWFFLADNLQKHCENQQVYTVL